MTDKANSCCLPMKNKITRKPKLPQKGNLLDWVLVDRSTFIKELTTEPVKPCPT